MQLFEEALKYLPKYIEIALVTQRGSKGDFSRANFTIGTHAMGLGGNFKPPSLWWMNQHRIWNSTEGKIGNQIDGWRERGKPPFLQVLWQTLLPGNPSL